MRKGRGGVKQVGINQDLIFRCIKLKRQIRHANEGIKEAIAYYDKFMIYKFKIFKNI